ncbi:MAG: hypothetical protein HC849_23455 [Oscillatoriales cyanobacterium RU_3_3]|nr:hypothetical protein [Oscillatoriales cyanobacterium RU_3_3]NJR21733.1 hypothetical protein [Richelia sp. CSU_2_1]
MVGGEARSVDRAFGRAELGKFDASYLGIAEKVSNLDNKRKWWYGGISERSLNVDREST